jgi:hypothetical protein
VGSAVAIGILAAPAGGQNSGEGARPAVHRSSHIVVVTGGKNYLVYTIRGSAGRDGMYEMDETGRSKKLPGPVLGADDGAAIANLTMIARGTSARNVRWWNVGLRRYHHTVPIGSDVFQSPVNQGMILRDDARHEFVFFRPRDNRHNDLVGARSNERAIAFRSDRPDHHGWKARAVPELQPAPAEPLRPPRLRPR